MKAKNKTTVSLIYVLVGVLFVYGIGLAVSGQIGGSLFTFSDGQELKKGLNTSDKLSTVSTSWIGWTIYYTDGSSEEGRTNANSNSISPLTLVNSVDSNPKIIQSADFHLYMDMSKVGNEVCFGTPSIKWEQKVVVNGQEVNVHRQLISSNELQSGNILQGSGIRITPSFFEGQILTDIGRPLNSGDLIQISLDANGRFDLAETVSGKCPTSFDKRFDGFVEGAHADYTIIYADPLDLASGTFPEKQTDIDDQPTTITKCENGVCDDVIISIPSCPTGQIYNVDEFRCEPVENLTVTNPEVNCGEGKVLQDGECIDDQILCATFVDYVCGIDGRTYSNSCFANANGIDDYKDGICENEEDFVELPEILPNGDDDNPSGTDGIIGVCDNELFDCEDGSPDIEQFVQNHREQEFAFNSFEFIMLVIIGIIIVAIIISRIAKK